MSASFFQQSFVLLTAGLEPYYLKHVDDKGGHLLVDDDLNFVGVTDWQMARIVLLNEAFGNSLVTADTNAVGKGKNGFGSKDRLLADFLRKKGAIELTNTMSVNENGTGRDRTGI